jgi:regulator of sigma E protease
MALDVLLGVALVLGVLILVHEWGHFIVARMFGVRVDVFSIGFGPRLFGWKRGATDYRVSAVPLGGYVRMAGQDMSEIDAGAKPPTGAPDELMSKPRWQRALISLAGPAVNLIFPVFLLAGFFAIKGEPYPPYLDQSVQIVAFAGPAQAEASPFHVGDAVVSINGVQKPTWEQLSKILSTAPTGSSIPVELENNGARRQVTLKMPANGSERFDIFGYAPVAPVIDDIAPNSPAERAGLTQGDRVVAVDGKDIQWWGQFVTKVRGGNGSPVSLKIARKNQTIEVRVTPEKTTGPDGETAYLIGVGPVEKYRPMPLTQSVVAATEGTSKMVKQTVEVVGALFTGRVSVKQLQSVVGISRAAGEAVRKGPQATILLMVLISVNLGILNLLPIPILDGGNVLLLAIEGGMRRDLSMAFKERFVQVGLVFLLVLFAYVMYNDVVRLLPIHS